MFTYVSIFFFIEILNKIWYNTYGGNMLDVLYEDNHIIVVYKESGVLSQEDKSGDLDILRMVKSYIKEKYNKPGEVYAGLVHRLDRNTAGLMVFARTSKAASRLSADIKNRNFSKKYYAVLEGKLTKNGRLQNKLLKNEKLNKSFVSDSGLEAILDYEVLENINIDGKDFTLVDITLHTGRHHQIRCQFSNIGYPLYGDLKYGSNNPCGNYFALIAYELNFTHPTLKEEKVFKYYKLDNIFRKFKSLK